ncbi:MAG: D-glycerate dehydrogenase [Proteobacteria bacterium]|nr:MAG: D-glycerate dehydrogenase [Pseudomonadota bacterium]
MKKKVSLGFKLPAGMKPPEAFELVSSEGADDPAAYLAHLEDSQVEGIVTGMGRRFDVSLISKLPARIKIIATASVGFDHIDVKAAAARGIAVTNTPDVLTDATADMTMLLILNVSRRMREYLELMKEGWGKSLGFEGMLGFDPAGKYLGIVGMGRIGQAVAARARAFGINIAYHNRHRLPPEKEGDAHYFSSLEEMLPHCKILSLNAPATAETKELLNKRTIALLPKGAIVVNVARGDLINEEDLIEALANGHLGGAGLDVFKNEPHFNRRLAEFPNVFLTPHAASATVETRTGIAKRAFENVARVLSGEAPRDLVQAP